MVLMEALQVIVEVDWGLHVRRNSNLQSAYCSCSTSLQEPIECYSQSKSSAASFCGEFLRNHCPEQGQQAHGVVGRNN